MTGSSVPIQFYLSRWSVCIRHNAMMLTTRLLTVYLGPLTGEPDISLAINADGIPLTGTLHAFSVLQMGYQIERPDTDSA